MLKRFKSMAVLVVVLFCSGLFCTTVFAGAEVNIRSEVVNNGLPLPRLFFPVPPPLAVIPGTYVYTAPDAAADIIFYQGAWYRPHGGLWFMASGYNGPWRTLSAERVPRALVGLPPNVRRVPPGHERMAFGHVERNWRRWEREQHWGSPDKKDKKLDNDDDHGRRHGRDRGKKKQKGRDSNE